MNSDASSKPVDRNAPGEIISAAHQPSRDIADALRESEERYRLLAEVTMEGIVLHKNAEPIDFNNAVCRLLDYDRATLLKRNFMEFVYPDDRAIVRHWISQDYAPPYTIRMMRRGGHLFYAEIESRNITRGNDVFRVSALRDVTERKHMEQELIAERDRAQTYLDLVGVIIIALDQTGAINLINRKGCNLLGLTEHELLGKNWINNFIPEEDRQKIQHVFNQIMIGQVSTVEYHENTIRTTHGQLRNIAWHNTVVRDSRHLITGLLSSGEDITNRKHTEESLAAQMTELRRWQGVLIEHADRSRELKREVNALLRRLGEPPRYASTELQDREASRTEA